MTLLLAPYNDSMKLGSGFNSYSQQRCIDNAITFTRGDAKASQSPAQTVSYSSRHISKLSDIVDSLNISPSNAIKKGTIEINGNTTTVDETIFKESDITFMVSVKVTNQTTSLNEDTKFGAIEGVNPGSAQFNDIYGDCFVSGFIEGGDLTGIVSMKVLDRSQSSKKLIEIKSALSSPKVEELTLESFDMSTSSMTGNAAKGTDCTISVSWMGGGQIKDESAHWDIDSLFAAAAAFPPKVAACPRKTWAILTKYTANRSFVETFSGLNIAKTLQYDQISTFTAELFDNFMDYKLLLKTLQNVIENRDSYRVRLVPNAIDLSMSTLLSVKSALRSEQSKIVDAIDYLSKDPGVLKRDGQRIRIRESETVSRILLAALGDHATDSVHGTSPPPASSTRNDRNGELSPSFEFESLVPPEIWSDLMPERKPDAGQSPILRVGLGTDSIATGGLTQTYEALRRELDNEKLANATTSATLDQMRERVSAQEATNAAALADLERVRNEKTALEGSITSLQAQKASAEQDVATKATRISDLEGQLSSKTSALTEKTNLATSLQTSVDTKTSQIQDYLANWAPVSVPASLRSNDVDLLFVAYGKEWVFQTTRFANTYSQLLTLIRNQQQFTLSQDTGPFQGWPDTLSGSAKVFFIIYRYRTSTTYNGWRTISGVGNNTVQSVSPNSAAPTRYE